MDWGVSRPLRRRQEMHAEMKVVGVEQLAALFRSPFFLDTPTPARLAKWRAKAQDQAAARAGFAFAPYGHLKLSAVIDGLGNIVDRLVPPEGPVHVINRRIAMWTEARARGLDRISGKKGAGASSEAIEFFLTNVLGFRIPHPPFHAPDLPTSV